MFSTQYVVAKPLPTSQGILPSGTVVDPTGWRHTDKLISQGFLVMMTETGETLKNRRADERPMPTKAKRARRNRRANNGSQSSN